MWEDIYIQCRKFRKCKRAERSKCVNHPERRSTQMLLFIENSITSCALLQKCQFLWPLVSTYISEEVCAASKGAVMGIVMFQNTYPGSSPSTKNKGRKERRKERKRERRCIRTPRERCVPCMRYEGNGLVWDRWWPGRRQLTITILSPCRANPAPHPVHAAAHWLRGHSRLDGDHRDGSRLQIFAGERRIVLSLGRRG